jgi:hypothetical protein
MWTSSISGSLSKVAKASLFIQTGYNNLDSDMKRRGLNMQQGLRAEVVYVYR